MEASRTVRSIFRESDTGSTACKQSSRFGFLGEANWQPAKKAEDFYV
jgi:hypothetical protein